MIGGLDEEIRIGEERLRVRWTADGGLEPPEGYDLSAEAFAAALSGHLQPVPLLWLSWLQALQGKSRGRSRGILEDDINQWRLFGEPRSSQGFYGVGANFGPGVCALLSCAESMVERMAAAASPRCGRLVLELLARDREAAVRGRVACNPSTPKELLERLSRDPEVSVRQALLIHPRPGRRLLIRMTSDRSSHVYGRAIQRLKESRGRGLD